VCGGRKAGRKERKTPEAKGCEMQPYFYFADLNALVISC
jgi:hypothetical protein